MKLIVILQKRKTTDYIPHRITIKTEQMRGRGVLYWGVMNKAAFTSANTKPDMQQDKYKSSMRWWR